jgi:hypothetical protein
VAAMSQHAFRRGDTKLGLPYSNAAE